MKPERTRSRCRTKPRGLLHGLANARGPLLPEGKVRVRAVIENPTSETWERAAWLVLHRTGITLWNAVCCVDPTFPTRAPSNDKRGRRRPWPRVPDQLTLVRAIRGATSGRITRKDVLATCLRDGF
jgi:hypothetical protein